ncbi:hypothetical protein ACFLZW_04925 [Chloroflexota bacterium]
MGWLDIVSLGIDAAQYYQINQARNQLTSIEEGRLAETYRREVLEVLRNYVFEILQTTKRLEETVNKTPLPVYVIASALKQRFEELGISPEIFPEFKDKEYVLDVQKRMNTVIGELSAEEIQQAEQCVADLVQMPILNKAIETQIAAETLGETREEWDKLSSRRAAYILWGVVALGFSLVICTASFCFAIPLGFSISAGFDTFGGLLNLVIFMFVLILFFASIIGGIILLSKSSTERYKELREIRNRAEGRIPTMEIRAELIEIFGEPKSDDLQKLKEERLASIRQVLGEIEGYDRLVLPQEGGSGGE